MFVGDVLNVPYEPSESPRRPVPVSASAAGGANVDGVVITGLRDSAKPSPESYNSDDARYDVADPPAIRTRPSRSSVAV